MDDRNMESKRTIIKDRCMSARSFPDEDHRPFNARPSSGSQYRCKHELPLPETERDPMRYIHLPGKTVGYKRVWMQDNPWPEIELTKGSASKRTGGQDQYRKKAKRLSVGDSTPFPNFVPGGTANDPLNLAGEGSGLLGLCPASEPDQTGQPYRTYVHPVNNYVLDYYDPLGLTVDIPFQPKMNPLRPKRKRTRAKKKEHVGMDAATTRSQSHVDAELEDDTSDLMMETVDETKADVGSGKNETAYISAGSKTDMTEISQSTANTETCNNEFQSVNTLSESKSGADQGDETASLSQRSGFSDGTPHSLYDQGDSSHNQQGTKENERLELTTKSGPFPPSKSLPGSQQQSKLCGSDKNSQKCKLEHNLQNKQCKLTYPVLLTPTDETDEGGLPRTQKSLRKRLKINPLTPSEVEEIKREREKKDREWRMNWRHPNLKSSEKVESNTPTDQHAAVQTLRTETNLAKAPLSEDFHIRKRRRTVSECNPCDSGAAYKRLNLRRSSSPDVRSSHAPPRKIRHLDRKSKPKVTDQVQKQSTVKFAKNATYRYGNYYRYYGYRTPDMAPDFRLEFLSKDWFEEKDVLDIGCNAGDFTLAVAQLFHPQKIVGMDIDPNLVRIARQNIRSHQTKDTMFQMEKYPVSTNEYGPIEPLPAITNQSNMFPKNVMFMQGNYVLKTDDQLQYVKEEYDTILALSVTKWIHLNYGDEGLRRAFDRMYHQLRPGGHLILEPQPWASYRRRKKLTPTFYKNYNSIKLKPNMFHSYLVNTVGFCSWKFLGWPLNPSKGFQRPMFLFTKYKDESPEYKLEGPEHAPEHSISQRMAQLAGYSSTPDLGALGPDDSQQDPLESSSQYETSSLIEAESCSSSSSGPSSPSLCYSASRTSVDSATSSLFHDSHARTSSEEVSFNIAPAEGMEEGDVESQELVEDGHDGLEQINMAADEEAVGSCNGVINSIEHGGAQNQSDHAAAVEDVSLDEFYSAQEAVHGDDTARPFMYNENSPETGGGGADGAGNAQLPEAIDVLPQQQSSPPQANWLPSEADQLLPMQEGASSSEGTGTLGEGYSSPANQWSSTSQTDNLNVPPYSDSLRPADPRSPLQGNALPMPEVQKISAQDGYESSSSVEVDNSISSSKHVQQTNAPLQHPEVSSSHVGLEMPLHQHDALASPEGDRMCPQSDPSQQEEPSPHQEEPSPHQEEPSPQQEDL